MCPFFLSAWPLTHSSSHLSSLCFLSCLHRSLSGLFQSCSSTLSCLFSNRLIVALLSSFSLVWPPQFLVAQSAALSTPMVSILVDVCIVALLSHSLSQPAPRATSLHVFPRFQKLVPSSHRLHAVKTTGCSDDVYLLFRNRVMKRMKIRATTLSGAGKNSPSKPMAMPALRIIFFKQNTST